MRAFFAFLTMLLPLSADAAGDCRGMPAFALQELRNPGADPEERAAAGLCLTKHYLDRADVSQAVLNVIRNPTEDILLREDLISAFADSPLRRKVKVEQALSPKLGTTEAEAVQRTLASAGDLLAVTQAVKSMDETLPVTRFEADFFQALNEIAVDDNSHVVLRETAVTALEKATAKVVASGVFNDKLVRLTQENLRTVASRADAASFQSGAGQAYARLANAGLPHFRPEEGRAISSVPAP